MTITTLDDFELDGVFTCPQTGGRVPGVLALGGSDGGLPMYFSRLLAAERERCACLALAYHGTPKTQPNLIEVPLERLERALRWLRDHPRVAPRDGRVGIVGASKGAELALVLATTFPDLVGPVVAYTPSSVVWAGIDFAAGPGAPPRSTWSRASEPLPFVRIPPGPPPPQSERGMRLTPLHERGLDAVAPDDMAMLPIERATGPVLLVSGGDDQMWPASRMSKMLVERARRFGREQSIQHLDFREAGHALFAIDPEQDLKQPIPFDLGGSEAAQAHAHAAAWPQALRVLLGQ
jgi:pimeloyl-ACP methyl ester carboxylesterase